MFRRIPRLGTQVILHRQPPLANKNGIRGGGSSNSFANVPLGISIATDPQKSRRHPLTVITNIEDLRVLAQKRVPRMFYDYADSGSWTESTYRANESD